MARRAIALILALAAGFVGGHLSAGRRVDREVHGVGFVHAVEGAGLAANALTLIERGDRELLAALLRTKMSDDLERAERLIVAVPRVDFPIPNLVAGVVKAEGLCRTDRELERLAPTARRVHDHLAALHAKALEEHAAEGG